MKRKIYYDFTKNKSRVSLYPIINIVFNERLRTLFSMVSSERNNSIILDIGCNRGYFSNILSSKGKIIGLDIDKQNLVEAKQLYGHIDFIQADISFFPFRNDSFDLVICASVLEHIKDLSNIVKNLKNMIKNRGKLIAAYPIERKLLLTIHRLFNPKHDRLINPNGYYRKEFWKIPLTHKQHYSNIRNTLTKHFLLIKKDKMPFKILPDWISIYEYVKLLKQ